MHKLKGNNRNFTSLNDMQNYKLPKNNIKYTLRTSKLTQADLFACQSESKNNMFSVPLCTKT